MVPKLTPEEEERIRRKREAAQAVVDEPQESTTPAQKEERAYKPTAETYEPPLWGPERNATKPDLRRNINTHTWSGIIPEEELQGWKQRENEKLQQRERRERGRMTAGALADTFRLIGHGTGISKGAHETKWGRNENIDTAFKNLNQYTQEHAAALEKLRNLDLKQREKLADHDYREAVRVDQAGMQADQYEHQDQARRDQDDYGRFKDRLSHEQGEKQLEGVERQRAWSRAQSARSQQPETPPIVQHRVTRHDGSEDIFHFNASDPRDRGAIQSMATKWLRQNIEGRDPDTIDWAAIGVDPENQWEIDLIKKIANDDKVTPGNINTALNIIYDRDEIARWGIAPEGGYTPSRHRSSTFPQTGFPGENNWGSNLPGVPQTSRQDRSPLPPPPGGEVQPEKAPESTREPITRRDEAAGVYVPGDGATEPKGRSYNNLIRSDWNSLERYDDLSGKMAAHLSQFANMNTGTLQKINDNKVRSQIAEEIAENFIEYHSRVNPEFMQKIESYAKSQNISPAEQVRRTMEVAIQNEYPIEALINQK